MNEVSEKIENYEALMDLIVIDPEIQHGEPVFKGTRITVHNIAGILQSGETEANLLEDYPRLSQEHLEAARLYARANPRRGRPAMKLPEPISESRVPLKGL